MITHKPIQVVAGDHHTIILINNIPYVWGYNGYGQLGLGDCNERNSLSKLSLKSDVKLIGCGGYYTIVVLESNKTYGWGENKYGQLGLGDNENRNLPHKLILADIKSIFCGDDHTVALTSLNKIYVWGANYAGQLGLGDNRHRNLPQELKLPKLTHIKSVFCDGAHTIALTSLNKIYSWGFNDCGQLGLGDNINKNTPQELILNNVVSVSCSQYHTIAMTSNLEDPISLQRNSSMIGESVCYEIYVWGQNNFGQLGLGDNKNRYLPTKLTLTNIKSIVCGGFHTIALTSDNKIYSWGFNYHGQLGLGDRHYHQNTPCLVNLNDVKLVSSGIAHIIAITTSNKLYVWGMNDHGQLGLGDYEDESLPQELLFTNGKIVTTNINNVHV